MDNIVFYERQQTIVATGLRGPRGFPGEPGAQGEQGEEGGAAAFDYQAFDMSFFSGLLADLTPISDQSSILLQLPVQEDGQSIVRNVSLRDLFGPNSDLFVQFLFDTLVQMLQGGAGTAIYNDPDLHEFYPSIDSPSNVGGTADRDPYIGIGSMHFDTDLAPAGKPIWWNGQVWVDATGAVV